MKKTVLALAAILAMSGTSVMAEDGVTDIEAKGGEMSFTMLELTLKHAFAKYGVDADPMALSMTQVHTIIGILSDKDRDSDGNSAKRSIEAALAK